MAEISDIIKDNKQEIKILVVEDIPELLFAYERILSKKGYTVLTALDGKSALDIISSKKNISLVLLDVMLPDTTGFEILRIIKSNPATQYIFVALISSIAINPDNQVYGLESGAEAYLLKPISNKELGAHIDSLIKHKQADDILRLNEEKYRIQSEKSELALRESNAYLHSILDNNSVAYIAVDRNGKIQFYNKLAKHYTEKYFHKLLEVGENINNYIEIENEESFKANFSSALNGKPISVEKTFIFENGQTGWVGYYYSPSITDEGDVQGVLFSIVDITDRKQIEVDLIIAKEKAQESDRLKTAFIQNLSHEIRTPMNAIVGFANLLAPNFNNKSKLESFTNIITQRCDDLLIIINNILDIAKIESGQLSVKVEPCNLQSLFENLIDLFKEYQKRLRKQHISFMLNLDINLTNTIITIDIGKLKQILFNLINNAFKYTESGKIELGCKLDKNENLLFHVSDTGIGIPADKIEYIFERFTQLHQSVNKNIEGNGLGLSIVKSLISLMGGEIFVESELNIGSTFSFSLPYKKA